MGYRVQLDNAAKWLATIQNSNDGWGRTNGLASSIVNTVEAVYVMGRANRELYEPNIKKGMAFVERVTERSLKKTPRTRYAFFALLAAADGRVFLSPGFAERLTAWMFQAQNLDGGWGHEASDGQSRLYPTVMALLALNDLGQHEQLDTACNWIASSQQPTGWSFVPAQTPNHVSTSMAILALRKFRGENDKIFDHAKSDLLTIDSWTTAKEDLPGADWVHSAHMWGFAALTALGFEPYVKPIAQGVRHINELSCDQGWREPDGHLTVRGQYWAVMAFEALQEGFDPAVHVYRIDSARAHSFTLEPEFAVIRPHTPWTTVIPSRVYRAITAVLFIFSALFFLGVNRLISDPGRYGDFFVSVALFFLGWTLIDKRPAYYPKTVKRTVLGLVALLSIIDLVFGLSVSQIWGFITFSR